MFTWTIGLSAPHPLYRPIWSCECCSTWAGWSISASLICHPDSSSISFVCNSVCAPTPWHPCPKWGSKSRTRWITGDRTPSRHHQGSPQTFGHVDLYGHPSAKRSVLLLPYPVMGIRGLVSGDRVLTRQHFSDPNHSPSGGWVGLSCSAAWGLTECLTDRDHSLYRCIQAQMEAQLGSHKLQGMWSRQQASQHINMRWRQCSWV